MTDFRKHIRGLVFAVFLCLIPQNMVIPAALQTEGSETSDLREDQGSSGQQWSFVVNASINDLKEFSDLAREAARLKKYGNVRINISTLYEKSFNEIPPGGNPWNEYASNNATLAKFFPDKRIAPFLPAEVIAKNRALLFEKAAILRKHGLEAAFFGNEPGFLPEAFFSANPHLRGPRVDHPRRSRVPCFSPCMSTREMQESYSNMVAELLAAVPEIKVFYFKTNDAGSGMCWSDWLYSGPNGPEACHAESTGERLAALMQAMQDGASKAGTKLDVYLSHPQGSSNFSDEEREDIQKRLPENCHFGNTPGHPMMTFGTEMGDLYPVLGIGDICSYVEEIHALQSAAPKTLFIGFSSYYDRGNENSDLRKVCFDLLDKYFSDPDHYDPKQVLHQYCMDWVGTTEADKLARSFEALQEALVFKRSRFNLNGIYWDVSSRIINRPLVAVPERLSPEEENYFLPHVFNVSSDEARSDYLDMHGGRWNLPLDTVRQYVAMIRRVATMMDSIEQKDIQNEFVRKLGPALRVHASLVRSAANFSEAQIIRDRNAEKLKGPVRRPSKEGTWTGDTDLLALNAVMRDELDNTAELMAWLKGPASGVLCVAKDKRYEDCFLLGPDLVETLGMKYAIMIRHWRDIEDYMTTPFK